VSHDLLAVALGAVAGMLSGLFGVGGGIIFVPTLIFLGLSSHDAVATSLAAMVPAIVVGAWRQTRYRLVDWRAGVVVGIASVPTVFAGERVATALSNATLRRLFAVLMLFAAVQLAVRALRRPAGGRSSANTPGIDVARRNAKSTESP
jgi:uncharacterized membrane protein YfcA